MKMITEGWISVKDRLPEYKKEVIIHTPTYSGKPVRIGSLDCTDNNGHNWKSDGYLLSSNSVTHWQPLPKPPKVAI